MSRPRKPLEELSPWTRYSRGERDPAIWEQARLLEKRYRRNVARRGPSTTDSTDTIARVQDLVAAGWALQRIAMACGFTHSTPSVMLRRRPRKVKVATAEAIRDLWELHCAPLEADTRTWPTEPLREALKLERGALDRLREENPALCRYIYRSPTVDLERADMAATKYLSGGPESVWPGWFGIEEVA